MEPLKKIYEAIRWEAYWLGTNGKEIKVRTTDKGANHMVFLQQHNKLFGIPDDKVPPDLSTNQMPPESRDVIFDNWIQVSIFGGRINANMYLTNKHLRALQDFAVKHANGPEDVDIADMKSRMIWFSLPLKDFVTLHTIEDLKKFKAG